MAEHEAIKLFEENKMRVFFDDVEGNWYFCINDVVQALTESVNPADYFKKMRKRDRELDDFMRGTNCPPHQFASTDGKMHAVKCASLRDTFRIIQSIPSKKAEPFKQWLAQVGAERIRQMQDPERSIEQMVRDYRRLGYSENWINQRIKTIEIRKGLTDEWKRSGVTEDSQYAQLTDLMSKVWSGMTTREYKEHKGLTDQNLRDNMTNMELLLNALAEQTATDLSKERNPEGMMEAAHVAKDGAEVARNARADIEQRLGHTVISDKKAIDYINPQDELPFEKKN
jgi:prophage antirepressor-like protein